MQHYELVKALQEALAAAVKPNNPKCLVDFSGWYFAIEITGAGKIRVSVEPADAVVEEASS